MIDLNKNELERFLLYLQEKVEFGYQEETQIAIEMFLNKNSKKQE